VIKKFFGSNNLNSLEIFQERALYKQYAMERYEDLNLMDFWYENPYYGMLDEEGFAVYPQEQLLVPYDGPNLVYGIDFVVRAYNAFYMDFLSTLVNKHGTGNHDSALININPELGTPSFSGMYANYQESIFEVFYSSLAEDGLARKKIRDFHTFLKYYFYFLNKVLYETPFTRTSFIKSLACPYNATGLTVDIKKNMDFSIDLKKKVNFIDDKAFPAFVEAAASYGLSVDKNAPWRLVARVGNTKMRIFMKSVGVDPDKMFEQRYVRAYTIDYEDFKLTAQSFYESFISAIPNDTYPGYSSTTGKFTFGTIRRYPITDSDFDQYPETYWLEKYYERRRLEENMSLSTVKIKNNMKKYLSTYRGVGVEEAVKEMEKDLAKLPPAAIPSIRKKKFDYGFLNPDTVIYSGKED